MDRSTRSGGSLCCPGTGGSTRWPSSSRGRRPCPIATILTNLSRGSGRVVDGHGNGITSGIPEGCGDGVGVEGDDLSGYRRGCRYDSVSV